LKIVEYKGLVGAYMEILWLGWRVRFLIYRLTSLISDDRYLRTGHTTIPQLCLYLDYLSIMR
jgi:hypothetical protein